MVLLAKLTLQFDAKEARKKGAKLLAKRQNMQKLVNKYFICSPKTSYITEQRD
jgi:hypothetical protein